MVIDAALTGVGLAFLNKSLIGALQFRRHPLPMLQSPNLSQPQPVAPLLALATELLRAGRPADAIAPLREASLLQPSNAIIQHDLGLACLEVGLVADAVAALRQAVASEPRFADAHFRLGIALEKLGDIGGAIVAFQPRRGERGFHLLHQAGVVGCDRATPDQVVVASRQQRRDCDRARTPKTRTSSTI